MGRHVYNNNEEFVKTTIEIEKDLHDKLISIRCDCFDSRSIKEIVNRALRAYLEE